MNIWIAIPKALVPAVRALLDRSRSPGPKMSESRFPVGWDAERIKRSIDDHEGLSEDEQVADDDRRWRWAMSESIISDPAVMMGKPVVSGTRITVELILEKLAAGESIEQLLEAHPRLTKPAVLVALGFAARALRADVLYPLGSRSA